MNLIFTYIYTELAFIAKGLEESQFYRPSRIADVPPSSSTTLIGGADEPDF